MILLNHGVFTFANNAAKDSYDNYIEIVSKRKLFKKEKSLRKYNCGKSKISLEDIAKIRSSVYKISNNPCIAILTNQKRLLDFRTKNTIDLSQKAL